MSLASKILDFLFPISCVGCHKANIYLCDKCIASIPQSTEILPPYVISIFNYQDPIIKRAIWMLKYRNKKGIADVLAKAAYDRLLEELSDLAVFENFNNPILIPIPLYKKRLKKRGYNQSELLAREITKRSDNAFTLATKVLYKTKDTKSQVEIRDKKERLKNLRGAFAVKNPETIHGRNIILIDDVTTTGATLNEAKKVLEKAGARKVIGVTVAH